MTGATTGGLDTVGGSAETVGEAVEGRTEIEATTFGVRVGVGVGDFLSGVGDGVAGAGVAEGGGELAAVDDTDCAFDACGDSVSDGFGDSVGVCCLAGARFVGSGEGVGDLRSFDRQVSRKRFDFFGSFAPDAVVVGRLAPLMVRFAA
ncbi:MAG: hypothetical protein ABI912_04420 [Actinomycetota bacterium]